VGKVTDVASEAVEDRERSKIGMTHPGDQPEGIRAHRNGLTNEEFGLELDGMKLAPLDGKRECQGQVSHGHCQPPKLCYAYLVKNQ
jgi:hypothetical protein